MRTNERKQTLYVLTAEDGDRIDHLIGVMSVAISELLVAKRIHIPQSPDSLPAENQLFDEKNELSGEAVRAGAYDF